MQLPLIPYPQRCTLLDVYVNISEYTPVILQLPQSEERLVRMAGRLFKHVEVRTGEYALFAAHSFAQKYPFGREEGYLLCVRGEEIWLAAGDARGLFYGMQTLKQWFEMPERPALEICDWPELSLRSDYLDMRGIYPKFPNLLLYVEEMARYKLNTLVIEYEDKLPRSRSQLCARTDCLTKEQHEQLLQTAYENFIDVIPLQQTFGHLEYVLKQPEYMHLRATSKKPGELCPLRKGSFEVVAELMEETARMHPDSRYLHLGCDEVWSLGQSPECKESGKSRQQLAIDFINRLAEKALELGKIPMIWHDMLLGEIVENKRTLGDLEILSQLNKSIVVAVWLYYPRGVGEVAPVLIDRLHSLGIQTLPCCAVRASDNRVNQNYPRIEMRLRNIDMWCDFIADSRVTGMINTNWCSTFALGNPYGLFETSRYTGFYAAERCWNLRSCTEDFMERFMAVYHGVYDAKITTGAERRYDYYEIVGTFMPRITRNRQTALLIKTMFEWEGACHANALVFRSKLYPGSEVELACLRERAEQCENGRREPERILKELLPELVSPAMAELFFESRTYPNSLFQREIDGLLKGKVSG
ncbi:MAG: family 20 glycosylhydrolase [Lachnospiraceae bacterium]|nr:family 20 glycosylhydrolase [Lachnospiraceae bacterium]